MSLCDGTWLPQCEWLIGWPVVGLIAALVAFVAFAARRRLSQFVRGAQFDQVLPQSVRTRRTIRDVLAFGGLALALFALAGPRFDKQLQIVRTSGTELVVLLDLSRSMDARDVDPSRLERARRELRDLGRFIAGDRVGLVFFAGGAYARLPLTEDYAALELVVSEAATNTFTAQGSDLGGAIRQALELLDNHEGQAGQALIVLSDGETHDAADARTAAEEAAARGIPIYAMGIGIESATIPMRDGQPLRHEGATVYTKPDFSTLEDVARATGGAFVQSNPSANDMEGLYREIRSSIAAATRDARQRETWREAFAWPLGLAVLALLVAGWLGDGRRRFGAATAVLLGLGLAHAPTAEAGPLEDADALYREEAFEKAADRFTQLSLQDPDDPDVLQRLGAARYRAGDYDGAARAFERAAELTGDPNARFNAGNAHYKAGRLERALERYDDALESSPEHPGATRNRSVVEQEIAQRRLQQPPPPPQPQPQNQEESEESEDSEGEESETQEGASEEQQEPADAQPSDQPPEEGEPGDATGEPGEPQDGDEAETVDPSEVEESTEEDNGETEAQGDAANEYEPTAPITEGQAHRLLDAIEEGRRQVLVRGASGDKPW